LFGGVESVEASDRGETIFARGTIVEMFGKVFARTRAGRIAFR
jgi:hypothetical protein